MDKNKFVKDPPFFGWDCITLNLKGKWDVHLIIRNENAMSMFLKLLIQIFVQKIQVVLLQGVKHGLITLKTAQFHSN